MKNDKYLYARYIFRTGWSRRVIDSKGALLKFKYNKKKKAYIFEETLIEDRGLRDGLIKITKKQGFPFAVSDDFDNSVSISLEIQEFDEENPITLDIGDCKMHIFKCDDDDSAKLFYMFESGDI